MNSFFCYMTENEHSYSKINSDLAEIESSILKLENTGEELTKELLKSKVNAALKRKVITVEPGKPVNPYQVFDEFVAQEGTEKQWAENTKRKWVTFKSHLTIKIMRVNKLSPSYYHTHSWSQTSVSLS